MATGQWPTLADLTSRSDSMGKQHIIAEMLSQSVVLHKDTPYRESSEMGGHEFSFRESIPAGAWRQINMGIPYAKSTTGKSRIGLGTLEAYSQVDRLLAEMSGDVERFREGEDVSFFEGMGQTWEENTWYGNTAATPAQFMGLSAFYNTVSTVNAQNAANCIDGGGTGSSNLSFWLIGWGLRTIFMCYPRSTKAGLAMEDKGDTVPGFDSLGNRFEAYTSWFRQMGGICPQDWRYGVRIPNVDVTNAGLAGPNAIDIFATMRQAMLLMPTLTAQSSGITEVDAPDESSPGIRPVWYMNRTGRHWCDVQAMRDRNVLLRLEDYAGKPTMGIDEIPIRVSDQLLTTEARVV
jgi:hypothetical protein